MASNAHGNEMLTLPPKVPGQKERKKPKVVDDYNHEMEVDKADQKEFFWLLEIAVVNSYILHKQTISRPLSHLAFQRILIKSLVSNIDFSTRPRPGRHRSREYLERLQPGKHFLSTGKRRDCVICSDRGSGERHLTKFHTARRLKRPREH